MSDNHQNQGAPAPTSQSSQRWRSDRIQQFLGIVENYPCLWNPIDPAYSNRIRTLQSRREVARLMTSPSYHVTEETVAAKLKNIRDKFRKVAKKLEGKTGTDAESIRLSVSWFEDARFLLPYVNVREVMENMPAPTRAAPVAARPVAPAVMEVRTASQDAASTATNAGLPSAIPRRRKRRADDAAELGEIVKTLTHCQTQLGSEDEADAFGNLVATMTRPLTRNERLSLHLQIMVVVQQFFSTRQNGPTTEERRGSSEADGRVAGLSGLGNVRTNTTAQVSASRESIGSIAGTSGLGRMPTNTTAQFRVSRESIGSTAGTSGAGNVPTNAGVRVSSEAVSSVGGTSNVNATAGANVSSASVQVSHAIDPYVYAPYTDYPSCDEDTLIDSDEEILKQFVVEYECDVLPSDDDMI